jgi:cytochrome c biogenesis protein CcmG/thiol:disulfide interchange protein DsbE
MGRWLPLGVFLALAVLLGAGVLMNAGKSQTDIESPLIGQPAPDFALPDFADPATTVRKADLLGQPYLVNIWASWCASCRVEHPVITDIAKSGRLQVVGYNYKDAPEDAERWLQQFGNPFHRIIVDADGRAAIDWGIYGAPETFLVDAEGTVRWKHVGPVTQDVVETQLWPLLTTLEGGR